MHRREVRIAYSRFSDKLVVAPVEYDQEGHMEPLGRIHSTDSITSARELARLWAAQFGPIWPQADMRMRQEPLPIRWMDEVRGNALVDTFGQVVASIEDGEFVVPLKKEEACTA